MRGDVNHGRERMMISVYEIHYLMTLVIESYICYYCRLCASETC